ncbi:MAG: hypothetical protein LKK00_09035 [Intestinimonas sp.]|jgi:protein-tyrosine phosphatase|nr:hypothetical protein [Intestinimonas sp.]
MTCIDFHAHILPRADHGSDSTITSLGQLEQAEKTGVEIVVATPHFYPGRHQIQSFIHRREAALNTITAAYRGSIRIIPAAEVLLCEGLQNLHELPELCVRGTKTLMLEMSAPPWSARQVDTLDAVREAGYQIVLVHPDRFPYKQVEKLFALGFRGQLNAEGLCRLSSRRRALRWVDQGYILALGSDVHGLGVHYRQYAHALKLLGPRQISLMETARALLDKTGTNL